MKPSNILRQLYHLRFALLELLLPLCHRRLAERRLLSTLVLFLIVANVTEALRGEEPEAHGDISANGILIRPLNYDPRDPWEYTRQQGRLHPGMSAHGVIWNRPESRQLYTGAIAADGTDPTAPPLPEGDIERFRERDTLVLGYSVKGIPIVLQLFGDGPDPVLIFAGIHGDEPNSVELIHHLLATLESDPSTYENRAVGIIAVANPDGFALDRRTNQHQVDVNRNFPARNWALGKPGRYFGGKEQSSEPETRAIVKGVELLQPSRIISIHSIMRGKHGNNYDGPGEKWAELMSRHNGYQVLKSIGYPTPGSFGSWAGVDRQIPTITLELPHDLRGEATWKETGASLLEFIKADVATGR